MKKFTLAVAIVALVAFLVPSNLLATGSTVRSLEAKTEPILPTGMVQVARFWSDTYRGHFYTADAAEDAYVTANYPENIWQREGYVFTVESQSYCDTYPGPIPSGVCMPVYRFWSNTYRHHFYTMSVAETNNIVANMTEWQYEGIVYYSEDHLHFGDNVPLYRFWSDTYKSHFYTRSEAEKANIQANMPEWSYEGVAYYVSRLTP